MQDLCTIADKKTKSLSSLVCFCTTLILIFRDAIAENLFLFENDISVVSIMDLDRVLHGDRLAAYRKDCGYLTATEFSRALDGINMPINARRLRRLERSESMPTPYEMDAICRLLGITSDCWLRGVCDDAFMRLSSKTQFLTDRQICILVDLCVAQIPVVQCIESN